jgi:hypothetical protein
MKILQKEKKQVQIKTEKRKKLEKVQDVGEEDDGKADWILAKDAANVIGMSVKRLDAYRMIVKKNEDKAIKKGYYLMRFKKINGRIYYRRDGLLDFNEFRERKEREKEKIKRSWRKSVTFEML